MQIELIDHMGSDLSVVNAARVSFNKESTWEELLPEVYELGKLKEADKRLIQFLARGMTTADFEKFLGEVEKASVWHDTDEEDKLVTLLWQWRRNPTHFTPFAHPHVTFRCQAPIFVARQLEKHQVGFTWSEVSRRYVDSEPEFFVPEVWRKRAEDVKQGSSEEAYTGYVLNEKIDDFDQPAERAYESFLEHAKALYNGMLRNGVCPEQARMVLPQSMMTEWIWTGSLYGWANVYNQRKPGSHAQREVWPFAEALSEHMSRLFPVSWEALTQ